VVDLTLLEFEDLFKKYTPKSIDKDVLDQQIGLFNEKIKARIKKEKDTRIITQGEAGEGKSNLSLLGGEIHQPETFIDNPEYAVNNQVHFSATAFLDAITYLKTHSTNIYDEPAQSWHHRQFMSDANIILSKTMIGFRYKKFITWLNIPHLDLIDLDAQKLCQFMIYVYKQGGAEVFEIQNRKFGGKPIFKKIVDYFEFRKVGNKLWKLYNKKKESVQDELYSGYRDHLKKVDMGNRSNLDLANLVIKNLPDFMKGDKLSTAKIQGGLDIGRNRADGIREKVNLILNKLDKTKT
jgi:hypothetical protein